MDGKLEKGEDTTPKKNASEGETLSDDNSGLPVSGPGGEVDDSDIKELSPEEVSALISPAPIDENTTGQEGLAKNETFEQKQSQYDVTDEIDSLSKHPVEGDSAPSAQRRAATEGNDPTTELNGKDDSSTIETVTVGGDMGTRINPDNSKDRSEEEPSNEPADSIEPNADIVVIADHDLDSPETGSNDNTEGIDGEKGLTEAYSEDSETGESDGLDGKFHSSHIKTLGAVLVGSLVLVAICGFVFYRYERPAPLSNLDGNAAVLQAKASPEEIKHLSAPPPGESIPNGMPQNRLLDVPDQLQKARNEMLNRAEILIDLQDQYRTGIHRIEEEMIAEIRQRDIPSLQQALNEKKIEFQLYTIQRRQAYIDHLEKPVRWLKKGSEELLFLQRKYEIESIVMPVCRDITTERLIVENEVSMRRYAPSVLQAQLKVDLETDRYLSLPQVWQNILQKKETMTVSRARPVQKKHSGGQSGYDQLTKNQAIWSEVCTGQFNRKCDLTALSNQAANCLAGWSEPDLFINRVRRLTPGAARNLRKWKGKWLGLNGLVELSPESASYLFTWEGDWVSLNGVMFLDAEATAHLVKWKGKTLEMMGLSSAQMARDPLAIKHLSAWQKKGNNLFVTDEIRQLIASEG